MCTKPRGPRGPMVGVLGNPRAGRVKPENPKRGWGRWVVWSSEDAQGPQHRPIRQRKYGYILIKDQLDAVEGLSTD
eukprot:1192862-Prorocentrum_minimum.AAC.1